MSEKITQIIDLVKELSVVELGELVSSFEEEFGVTAAAVAVAGAGAAASLYSAASHLPNRVQCPGGNGGGRGQPGGSPVSRISAGVYAGTDRDFFDCDAHARKSD